MPRSAGAPITEVGTVKNASTKPGNVPAKSFNCETRYSPPSCTSAITARRGLKSRQLLVQPTHVEQCEFGTTTYGVCPYRRCTGMSGQNVPHHPLFPLNTTPPANAAANATSMSTPTAGPL